MDDLELTRKIADIEGLYNHVSETKPKHVMVRDSSISWIIRFVEYNPLTDDALCHKLMIKYKVNLRFYIDGSMCAFTVFSSDGFINENPNRAICLAIIESHSDR